jgi:hypothetical protein
MFSFVINKEKKRYLTFFFLVLCTAPRTYSIAEPQGEIRPQHSVDT